MQAKVEEITPQLAKTLLKRNTNNRPRSQSYEDFLVRQIRDRNWIVNGESIKIGKNGRIIDGQSRLHAVVKSGCTIKSLVARGITREEEAFLTTDEGRPRNLSHALYRVGEKNCAELGGAIYVYSCYNPTEKKLYSKKPRLSNLEGLEVLNDNPFIRDSVMETLSMGSRKIMPAAKAAGFHAIATHRTDIDWANRFWKEVLLGEDLSVGQPTYYLRRRLIDNKTSDAKLTTRGLMELVFKCWNAWWNEQELSKLHLVGKVFPLYIAGYEE